ncbi:NF-kappa-B inhibitor cactus-like [Haliotis rubra]|uniref:NF-kappa-B inhibitor cactus-like n=1 Tax=Haliotis rubra TaxID=36100 RepID=UPI001EE50D06|nr:NF-kappa-B inhibitor cactus-like [Haliotis rubra]
MACDDYEYICTEDMPTQHYYESLHNSCEDITDKFQNISIDDNKKPVMCGVCLNVNISDCCLHANLSMDCEDIISPTQSECVDLLSQDKDGDTNLHIAIIQREICIVRNMIGLAPHSDWLNTSNGLLQTPLHLAVITRQIDVVRRLITSGASPDVRDLHGNTPLHIACREGYGDIVEYLLTPRNFEEVTDLKLPHIPRDLSLRNYEGHSCVHLAAMETNLRVMDLLLSAGADINIGDGKSRRTVLHRAIETGNRILLHFLLMFEKLDVNCTTYAGLTPLALAAGRGYNDIVAILISNGADTEYIEKDSECY